MIYRLRERPSKAHVVDALSSLATFSKIHRKKIRLALEKRQNLKSAAVANSRAAPSNANQAKPNNRTSGNISGNTSNPPSTLPSSSFDFTSPPPSTIPPLHVGMEEV